MLKEVLQGVARKWENEGLIVAAPSYSEEQIGRVFAEIGKPVSADVVEVYRTLGGMADGEIDENLLCFWNLDRLIAENSVKRNEKLVFCGDFLIYSHLYGFQYENEFNSSVYSDFESENYAKVADSIEDFLNFYLTEPTKIGLYEERVKQ